MIAAFKAEFRKLLSVRSTYLITLFVFLLVATIAFTVQGYMLKGDELRNTAHFTEIIFGAMNVAVIAGITAIVSTTQEYRFNTILYTLTSTNSRSRVFFAKLIVVSVYSLLLTALIAVTAPLFAWLGVQAHGNGLVPQSLDAWGVIWRTLFFGWSYGIAGLVLALIIRNLAGALATLLIFPGVIESLLTLPLKKNAVYLPFSAQNQVISGSAVGGASLEPGKAALVFSVYLALGLIMAFILFQKRDAN